MKFQPEQFDSIENLQHVTVQITWLCNRCISKIPFQGLQVSAPLLGKNRTGYIARMATGQRGVRFGCYLAAENGSKDVICSLGDRHQRFREICCLHLQDVDLSP